MRQHLFAVRIIVIAGLAFGWLVGLLAQRSIVEETSYMDISPGLLVLGLTLCALAGAAARIGAPDRHQVRVGALAGIGMVASIVAGYIVLVIAYRDRFGPDTGGETWWTLLLESWFWIGVPLVSSAILGAVGWIVADRLQRIGGRSSV
jgi:heme/copper-type cytochrome/quinol oxidase subunit 2